MQFFGLNYALRTVCRDIVISDFLYANDSPSENTLGFLPMKLVIILTAVT